MNTSSINDVRISEACVARFDSGYVLYGKVTDRYIIYDIQAPDDTWILRGVCQYAKAILATYPSVIEYLINEELDDRVYLQTSFNMIVHDRRVRLPDGTSLTSLKGCGKYKSSGDMETEV